MLFLGQSPEAPKGHVFFIVVSIITSLHSFARSLLGKVSGAREKHRIRNVIAMASFVPSHTGADTHTHTDTHRLAQK